MTNIRTITDIAYPETNTVVVALIDPNYDVLLTRRRIDEQYATVWDGRDQEIVLPNMAASEYPNVIALLDDMIKRGMTVDVIREAVEKTAWVDTFVIEPDEIFRHDDQLGTMPVDELASLYADWCGDEYADAYLKGYRSAPIGEMNKAQWAEVITEYLGLDEN